MTSEVDIVNRALQVLGTRTTVTSSELANETSNEAIQVNLILAPYRDQLLRMAPWNCGISYINLSYLTSSPGTPENTSPATNLWTPGQPAPPWSYAYMYPDDCVRAAFVIPSQQTGFAGAVPITTAVTGGAPAFWQGQPVRYKVAIDRYLREATGIAIVDGGTGYAVNDKVVLGGAPTSGEVPAGLVQINVDTVDGSGTILTASLADFPNLDKNSLLYSTPTYNLDQISTTGLGSGAIVSVDGVDVTTFSARTILTNQQNATLACVQQVTDPNVMDPDFIEAWVGVLGGGLCQALTGDKALANMSIGKANMKISEARQTDGNEGLTINNVTPDFIRVRGIADSGYVSGPWNNFDWGGLWPIF